MLAILNTKIDGRPRWQFMILTAIIALPVTAVFTYPLVFNLNTHIAGFWGSDALNHAWASWWFDKALFTLNDSPANIAYIYYPTLIHHPKVIAAPWAKLIALPFINWASPVLVYNAHLFVSYILTWVFMALLCLELTKNQAASIIGGAIFTFTINRTAHVFNGHLTQVLAYSYPLLVLAFFWVMEKPTVKRGIFLGLMMASLAILDLMPLAYFGIPIFIGLMLHFFVKKRSVLLSKQGLLSLGSAIGISALIVVPFFFPLLVAEAQGSLDWYAAAGSGDFSTDLLSIIIPPPEHPLSLLIPGLQSFSDKIYSFGLSRTEAIGYAGLITLALAGIGISKLEKERRDIRLWFFMAAICFVFAMGPLLRIAGNLMFVNEVPIIMPYAMFLQVPFLSWGRTPARLVITTIFALSILAAHGLSYLLPRIKQMRMRQLTAVFILFLILIDSTFIFPWPMMDVTIPPVFTDIAADSRSVAVLDLPVLDYEAAKVHMLYQFEHQHAIVGGFRTRRPEDAANLMTQLESAALPGGDINELAENGIAYVVLHHDFYEGDEIQSYTAALTTQVGDPIYTDDLVTVFTVPNAREIAPSPLNQ